MIFMQIICAVRTVKTGGVYTSFDTFIEKVGIMREREWLCKENGIQSQNNHLTSVSQSI